MYFYLKHTDDIIFYLKYTKIEHAKMVLPKSHLDTFSWLKNLIDVFFY